MKTGWYIQTNKCKSIIMESIFKPIGVVHSPFKNKQDIPQRKFRGSDAFDKIKGELEIFSEFKAGLKDIEGFSHLILLFNFHKSEGSKLFAHPPFDNQQRGVFATRSPNRPNAIGVTIVQLLGKKDNILQVAGIDVIESTPILDIKPYTNRDQKPDATFGWLTKKTESDQPR